MIDLFLKESAKRLVERLNLFKLQPECVLNASCNGQYVSSLLKDTLPASHIIMESDLFCLSCEAHSVDLVVSNLLLYQFSDYKKAIAEFRRVLKPGGTLLLTTLGIDSFQQLDAALQLTDLHDIGDAFLAQQFVDPVMDMEMIEFQYPNEDKLQQTVEDFFGEKAPYKEACEQDGYFPLTFQLVYAQAMNSQYPNSATLNEQGEAVISIDSIKKHQ